MGAGRMFLGAVVAAALAATLASSPASAQTEAAFKTGGWSGTAHFDAQKKFLYCVVSRGSPDGIEYGFQLTPQLAMFVGLHKREWNMQPSENYGYSVELGGYRKTHNGTVTSERRNTLWINVGNDADLRRAIAAGGTITLVGAGNVRFAFSLDGSDNAMRKLLACAALFGVD